MKNARKILCYILMAFVTALSATMLTACGAEPTELTSNMINLGFTAVTYDGTAKTPAVTIKIEDNEVSRDEYSVEYSNNTLVGTGIVKITSNEDSKVISGTVSVGFEITKATKTVTTLAEINSAIEDANFSGAEASGAFTLLSGETLTIPENFTLNFGDNVLTNNGKIVNNGIMIVNKAISGAGTIENNGEIVSNVKTFSELAKAFEFANKVVLAEDIGLPTAIDRGTELYTCTNAKYEEITLDLNGHKLGRVVRFESGFKTKKVTFTSSTEKAEVNVVGLNDCALYFRGNERLDVQVSNIKFVGDNASVKTNGQFSSRDFSVKAINCDFDGTTTTATYLPAQYNYTFENCTFTGITAYYTKSGNHKLINCTLNATKTSYIAPSYNGNGCDETGSALVLDSSQNYIEPLVVTITGGNISSVSGYAIEEYTTSKNGTQNFYSTIAFETAPTMTSGAGRENMFVPQFTLSSDSGCIDGVVSVMYEKLDNIDVLSSDTTYSVREIEERIANLKLYVELGTFSGLNSLDRLAIGSTEFSKNEKVVINIANENKIEDKAFYVQDSKIFVLAPILKDAETSRDVVKLNGKEFVVQLGSETKKLNIVNVSMGGTSNSIFCSSFGNYNAYISSLTLADTLKVECMNIANEDKVITKTEILGNKTYSMIVLEEANISQNIIGIYPDFSDVPREFDGEYLTVSIFVEGKGVTAITINIDLSNTI